MSAKINWFATTSQQGNDDVNGIRVEAYLRVNPELTNFAWVERDRLPHKYDHAHYSYVKFNLIISWHNLELI